MQLTTFIDVRKLHTCLLMLLMLRPCAVTSQSSQILMNIFDGKRFNVEPRDVIKLSSKVDCAATCRDTSWCVSANLQIGDGTCQLLSEEASNETSLATVDGWRYLREFGRKKTVCFRTFTRKID